MEKAQVENLWLKEGRSVAKIRISFCVEVYRLASIMNYYTADKQ